MVTIKEHTQRYSEVMQEIMVAADLTDQRFADSVGVARALISHIRNGKQNASIDLIVETARVYEDVNTDYILTGRGDPYLDRSCFSEKADNYRGVSSLDVELREKEILKLQEELREAYMEIGRLNMKLKSTNEYERKKIS